MATSGFAPFVRGIDLTALYQRLAEDKAEILAALEQMEQRIMTTQEEAFATLGARVDATKALAEDILADFNALLAALAAERENLTPAGQAAFDAALGKADAADAALSAVDVAVGDADGSDTPPAPEPTPEPEPAPEV